MIQDEAQVNVARDIAVQMCDVFEQRDYVGVVNVSYMAAVNILPDLTVYLVMPSSYCSLVIMLRYPFL